MRQGEAVGWNGAGSASPADTPRAVVPAIVFHGDHDRIVHPRNAEQVLGQLGAGTKLERVVQHGQAPGGHTYTRTLYADASGRVPAAGALRLGLGWWRGEASADMPS